MTKARAKVGMFGGTFDPVHVGHLRMALELKEQLRLDAMRLVPCHRPPHRGAPAATSQQRAEMLRIALAACSDLQVDERELRRDRPSYTYDTLCELRAELGADTSLVLCMGADAFAGLASWFRWQDLLSLAHIVVIHRPGWSMPEAGEVAALAVAHQRDISALDEAPAGALVLHSPRRLPISSTEIRKQVAQGESAQFLVPDAVWSYIVETGLYR